VKILIKNDISLPLKTHKNPIKTKESKLWN